MRMLIDAKCEIDATERSFGMTALDMAILNGDVESSAVLVSSGGDPDHLMKMFALSDLYEVLVLGQRKELKVRLGTSAVRRGLWVEDRINCIVQKRGLNIVYSVERFVFGTFDFHSSVSIPS